MKTKVFTKNKNGKIEFTEKELKKLLDEIYDEGYNEGSQRYYYTTPYYYRWPTYYTTCTNGTTASNSYTLTSDSSCNIVTANGGNYGIAIDSNSVEPTTTTATTAKNGKTYTYKVKRNRLKDKEEN